MAFAMLCRQIIKATGHPDHLARYDTLGRLKRNYQPKVLEQIATDMGTSLLCAYAGVRFIDPGESRSRLNDYLQIMLHTPGQLEQAHKQGEDAVKYVVCLD